jgi:hypothetical protein
MKKIIRKIPNFFVKEDHYGDHAWIWCHIVIIGTYMVWKTHIQLMNISLSFLYFPKLMIYGSMGVVITILLKNHTRSLLQRRVTYVVISSPSDILGCTRYIFLRSQKKERKDENGIRWMRIQICWSLDFFFSIGLLLLMKEW